MNWEYFLWFFFTCFGWLLPWVFICLTSCIFPYFTIATENFLTKAGFWIYVDFDIHLKTALNKQTNKQILTDTFVSNKYSFFFSENITWHFSKISSKKLFWYLPRNLDDWSYWCKITNIFLTPPWQGKVLSCRKSTSIENKQHF